MRTEVFLEEMRVWNLLYDNRGGVKWVECSCSWMSHSRYYFDV